MLLAWGKSPLPGGGERQRGTGTSFKLQPVRQQVRQAAQSLIVLGLSFMALITLLG